MHFQLNKFILQKKRFQAKMSEFSENKNWPFSIEKLRSKFCTKCILCRSRQELSNVYLVPTCKNRFQCSRERSSPGLNFEGIHDAGKAPRRRAQLSLLRTRDPIERLRAVAHGRDHRARGLGRVRTARRRASAAEIIRPVHFFPASGQRGTLPEDTGILGYWAPLPE